MFKLESFLSVNEVKGNTMASAVEATKTATVKAAVVTKDVAVKAGKTMLDLAPAHRGLVKQVEEDSILRDRELVYELRKNRETINRIALALGLEGVQDSTKEEIEAALALMAERAVELEKKEKEAIKAEKKENSSPAAQMAEQIVGTVSSKLEELLKGSKEEVLETASKESSEVVETVVEAPVPAEKPLRRRRLISSASSSKYNYNNSGTMA